MAVEQERPSPYMACNPCASPWNMLSSLPPIASLTKYSWPCCVLYTYADDQLLPPTNFSLTTAPPGRLASIQSAAVVCTLQQRVLVGT